MKKQTQLGQGLIEIIIVVLIISSSILALLLFQSSLAYADTLAQQQTEATILAESEMETLRTFQVLNTQSPYAAYQGITSSTSSSTGVNTTYTITWTVTTNVNPNYKNISVAVTWTDVRNKAQTITVVSNIAGIEPSYSATVMY